MEPIIVAQILSIVAMACNIISYQGKTKNGIIILQLIGSCFFGASYFILGATSGAILNVIAVIRCIIYMIGDKVRAGSKAWLFIFGIGYVAAYVLTFTVFGKEPNLWNLLVEALPVIGSLCITIGYSRDNAAVIRIMGIIASPIWLLYNIISFSIGGILCEAFSLVSIIIGIFRHDKKEGKLPQNTEET